MTTQVRITNPCRSEDGLSILTSGSTPTLSDEYARYVVRAFGAVPLGDPGFTQNDYLTQAQRQATQAMVAEYENNSLGGSALWVAATYTTTIPLDGNKVMPPRAIVGATTFTVAASPAAGGSCYFKLTANGSNTPTFTGMVAWGGSAGWVNTAGTINNVQCFYDGTQAYYSVTQNGGAPVTIPTFISAVKTGLSGSGTLTVTLSAAVANSGALDPAQFRLSTINGTAQTDTVTAATAAAGTTLTLTTSRPATVGDTTTVSYDPTAGDLAKRLVDASGNLLFAWDNAAVTVTTFVDTLAGVSTALFGAWSTRRLRAGYTGSIIKIRNSLGNQQDIGYTADGWADDSAITAFLALGNGTGSISKWYDQSGNGNDMTAANGLAGWEATLVKVAGRWMGIGVQSGGAVPTGTSSGTEYRLSATQNGSAFFDYTTGMKYAVLAIAAPRASGNGVIAGVSSTGLIAHSHSSTLIIGNFGNTTGSPTGAAGSTSGTFSGASQLSYIRGGASGATGYLRRNGSALINYALGGSTPGAGTAYQCYLMSDGQGSGTSAHSGNVGEVIWFKADPTGSDLTTVEARQSAAWTGVV